MRYAKPALISLAVIVLLTGAYAAAGYWLAPRLIKSRLPAAVMESTGQRLALGAVVVAPFALSIDVRDIALTEPDGAPLVAVRRLFVDADLVSLWRRALVLRTVSIEQPVTHLVVRADGSLNLVTALTPKAPDPAQDEQDGEGLRLFIAELSIVRGRVEAADLRRPVPVRERFEPIDVRLRDFTTLAGGAGRFRLAAEGAGGARVGLRGRFKLEPFELAGGFALQGLPAARAWKIAGSYDRIAAPAGTLTMQTAYRVRSTPEGVQARLEALDVSARDVGIRPPGAEQDWISLPALDARGASVDLTGGAVDVAELVLQGLHVRGVRERDGSIDLLALAPPAAAPGGAGASPPAEAQPAAPWRISLPSVRVQQARVEFTDRGPASAVAYSISPLDVALTGYASDAASVRIEVAAGVNDTGKLALAGDWRLTDSAGEFDIEANALPLPFLQPYLDESTDVVMRSGSVSSKGKAAVALPANAPASVSFDGSFALNDFRSVDRPLGEDFIRFRALDLQGLRYRSDKPSLRIREAIARGSYFKLVIAPDQTTNIAQVLAPERLAASAQPSPPEADRAARDSAAAPVLDARIDRVRFVDGSANFADLSIRPSFATGIQELEGTVTGLSSAPDSRADVRLDGKVDRYAPVEIRGQVNYLAATSYTNLAASFSNIELPTFTPYSGKFMGYEIAKGKLNARFEYVVENRRLDARHKFVLDQLTLGDRVESPDAVRLPVKLALALLKDRNGVIDIDLPVSGTLDDPKFRLAPIIWKALVNLLVKIATAPFALLGSLFGAGEEVRFVDFAFGASELDDGARERLGKLGGALAERPQLRLEVPLVLDAERDRAALSEASFARTLDEAKPGVDAALLRVADAPAYLDLLEDAWRNVSGEKRPARPDRAEGEDKALWISRAVDAAELRLRERMSVSEQDLAGLAKRRADAVREAVIGPSGIDPARVFVTTNIEPAASTDTARLALKLE